MYGFLHILGLGFRNNRLSCTVIRLGNTIAEQLYPGALAQQRIAVDHYRQSTAIRLLSSLGLGSSASLPILSTSALLTYRGNLYRVTCGLVLLVLRAPQLTLSFARWIQSRELVIHRRADYAANLATLDGLWQ